MDKTLFLLSMSLCRRLVSLARSSNAKVDTTQDKAVLNKPASKYHGARLAGLVKDRKSAYPRSCLCPFAF
jgi:hypothetical protein